MAFITCSESPTKITLSRPSSWEKSAACLAVSNSNISTDNGFWSSPPKQPSRRLWNYGQSPQLQLLQIHQTLPRWSLSSNHHVQADSVGNLTKIPTCEKQNRPRENTRQRKQSHAQDNIYVVRQFAYVHGVAEILLLSGKIQ